MKQKVETVTQINVIWKGRKQTLKECAETFLIFLERLKLNNPIFNIWYETGYSREEGMKNSISYELDYIKNKLCTQCNDSDYPEFDFDIRFWNGGKTDSTSFGISASLGGDGKVGNSICNLTFPYEGEIYEYYRNRENWEKLLELFIDHWQPDQYRDFNDQLVSL